MHIYIYMYIRIYIDTRHTCMAPVASLEQLTHDSWTHTHRHTHTHTYAHTTNRPPTHPQLNTHTHTIWKDFLSAIYRQPLGGPGNRQTTSPDLFFFGRPRQCINHFAISFYLVAWESVWVNRPKIYHIFLCVVWHRVCIWVVISVNSFFFGVVWKR